MNVGLVFLARDFIHLGDFAEDCWFEKTWELYQQFKVLLIIFEFHSVPKTRRRDKALMGMGCFNDCGIYNIKKLEVLNRVCKYKKVHSIANVMWCEGKTLGIDSPDSTVPV